MPSNFLQTSFASGPYPSLVDGKEELVAVRVIDRLDGHTPVAVADGDVSTHAVFQLLETASDALRLRRSSLVAAVGKQALLELLGIEFEEQPT
ncbi:MAG: hypothetical protein SFV15_22155 [Polyangiaceae bacterium]|nr:hypothetical protein [Polyangiaceae bacterium]